MGLYDSFANLASNNISHFAINVWLCSLSNSIDGYQFSIVLKFIAWRIIYTVIWGFTHQIKVLMTNNPSLLQCFNQKYYKHVILSSPMYKNAWLNAPNDVVYGLEIKISVLSLTLERITEIKTYQQMGDQVRKKKNKQTIKQTSRSNS